MARGEKERKDLFWIRLVLGRVGFLYLAFTLMSVPLVRYRAVGKKARATALSRLIPDFGDLIRFSQGEADLAPDRWEDYRDYFQRLTRHLPGDGHAAALLGYCYYHLGKTDLAVESYRRAVKALPGHFIYHYNLGALLASQGRHPEAVREFGSAQNCDPRVYIYLTTSSRVLFPLYGHGLSHPEVIARMRDNLKKGLEKCFLASVVSSYQVGDYQGMIRLGEVAVKSGSAKVSEFLYYSGVAHHALQQYDEARGFFQRCLDLRPDHARALVCLVAIDRARGQKSPPQLPSPSELEHLIAAGNPAADRPRDLLQLY